MNASENMFSLEGQVALVTGGNGGLGFAIAEALGNAIATPDQAREILDLKGGDKVAF